MMGILSELQMKKIKRIKVSTAVQMKINRDCKKLQEPKLIVQTIIQNKNKKENKN